MPQSMLYALIIAIVLIFIVAAIGTVRVGLSKENNEGNPEYEKKTTGNITRLTVYYIGALIVGLIAVALFIRYA